MFTIMTHIETILRLAFMETIETVNNEELDEKSGIVRIIQPVYSIKLIVIYIYQIPGAFYYIPVNLVRLVVTVALDCK